MKNLLTFLIHDYDLVMYMYIIIDMTLIPDFDNGLYRAHTFYDKVSRHEWIFKFAAIKHLNVHIKVKLKKKNCIPILEILPLLNIIICHGKY